MERFVATARELSRAPLPPLSLIEKECGSDALCAARLIQIHLGVKARLEKTIHPDTDSIRRVTSLPSVSSSKWLSPNTLQFALNRFGRKAVFEIETALQSSSGNNMRQPLHLIIDLRQNGGGSLKQMLRVASLFFGPTLNAIKLTGMGAEKVIDIPGRSQKLDLLSLKLIVGLNTASSAEVFAGLARVHAKARIVGDKTYGKNYLLRVIPVTHDWRLLIPAETIFVPGVTLAGGLSPDVAR